MCGVVRSKSSTQALICDSKLGQVKLLRTISSYNIWCHSSIFLLTARIIFCFDILSGDTDIDRRINFCL
jgi:hypothetical protein